MASVTERIKSFKQPRGGYIKPSEFEIISMDDGIMLNAEENIHGSVVGMAVDYLTRLVMGTPVIEAFKISIQGVIVAEKLGVKNAKIIAKKLIKDIKGLDDKSIINACKLVTFDVWLRNPMGALMAKNYKETNPDIATIENIRTLVNRSIVFFKKYGPITKDGFTFEPESDNIDAYNKMHKTGQGTYGGYTATVDTGDGDFLTVDTLWDFKVSKSKPTNKHTLQIIMYWIMGQHSGQKVFKGINKVGIFNPRLNNIYLLDISKVSKDVIETIEKDVICY